MASSGLTGLSLIAAVTVGAATALRVHLPTPSVEATRLCTLEPGRTRALLRVERDTTLPLTPVDAQWMSFSGVRPGPHDSLLATPGTPMPAARVRLLQLDSTTRAALAAQGVPNSQPVAFIRAAPYRADCRTIRWTDTIPFVVRGEVGYVRATIAPRERWIAGVPVLVVPDAWNYPYPRRRNLAYGAAPDAPLASAEALFHLETALERPRPTSAADRIALDRARRERAIAWARANPEAAELPPVRTSLRRAILEPDHEAASRSPSRLRGTYRVDIETGGERSSWFFRTLDRPGASWRGADSLQSIAALLVSPHILGYQMNGFAATSRDSLPAAFPNRFVPTSLVWLGSTDRPTTPDNDARRALTGMLGFPLGAVPERLWNDLDPFVQRWNPADSALYARLRQSIPRATQQARLPITVRLDDSGGVHADTTLTVGGRALRLLLERIDTIAIRRTF